MKRGVDQNSGEVDISYYDGKKNFYSLFIITMPVNIRVGEGWLGELQKNEQGQSAFQHKNPSTM